MSSDKKQDEDTGAEEPRADETLGGAGGKGRTDDRTPPDGIEDAEVLGETVADGSRFDHDADATAAEDRGEGTSAEDPGDATAAKDEDDGTRSEDWTAEPSAEGQAPDGAPWASAQETTDDDGDAAERKAGTGDEPGAERPNAPDDAEPLSAASAVPDAAPDPAPAAAPVVAPEPAPARKSGGGFMPALLGGVVAAGLGFGAAHYDLLGTEEGPDPVAQGLAAQSDRLAGLEQQIAALAETVGNPDTGAADLADAVTARLGEISDTLGSQLSDVAGSVSAVRDDLSGAISGVASRLGEVETRLVDVTERLSAVERRPLTESSEAAQAAFDAYERDIAALREQLSEAEARTAELNEALQATAQDAQGEIEAAEARAAEAQAQAEAEAQAAAERAAELQRQAEAEAQEMAAQAEALARAAATREALASLDAAIEKGAPFEETLAKLSDYADIPEPLSAAAGSGVASLAALRESFDPAAREALDASIRATVGDDPASRVTAFLRAQTGLRSLAPKEGDDPDAVLSRADAAVENGDIATALTELEALPDTGQAAMADWVAKAETRLAVTQAAASLSDTLLAN